MPEGPSTRYDLRRNRRPGGLCTFEAIARALDSVARQLTIAAQDIQVDDIKIKTIEKAKLFSELSRDWRAGTAASAASAAFDIVALSSGPTYRLPQGIPDPLYGEYGVM